MARAVGYIVAGTADGKAKKSLVAMDRTTALKIVAFVCAVWTVVLFLLLTTPV